jgi:predicted transcriptional regulator
MASPRRALPPLGELEVAVLEHLWRVEEADVLEVHAAVGKRRSITANTVGSALERLYKKGILTRHKVSHAYRYSPAITEDEYRARRVVEAAGGFSALANVGLLSAFLDLVADTDERALARLEQLIAKKQKERS